MKKSILFLLIAINTTAYSQNKNFIIGYIKDSVTNQTIPFASITNLSNSKTTIGDQKGLFRIDIRENQLLSIAYVGYNFDTIRISKDLQAKDTITFFLSALARTLQDVTVRTTSKYDVYQLDSIQRRKNYFGSRSDAKIPVASLANSGAGIGINLDHYLSKSEKKRNNWIDMFDVIEREEYINYHFTPDIVHKYTGLQNDSLTLFIKQYRPKYDWLRGHKSEEDMLYYINGKLKLFFKRDN